MTSPPHIRSAYVSIRQHTSAYVSILKEAFEHDVAAAYQVSIRQHTSAYVSILHEVFEHDVADAYVDVC
jgi:hypothetical protein